jgi:UDP-N-acetylmuramoylalanine--D-glutamate ligase
MGVTGAAVAHYLEKHRDRVDEVVLLEGDVEVRGHFDLIIISPGIAPHTALYQSAQRSTDDLISEIEFAYRESSNRWVAVTGTNGKTTTVALATHLLNGGGQDARSVGNIGIPAISIIDEVDPDTILVAEVSSFQLATCAGFSPCVAALINITPDHLNWHRDMGDYVDAKCMIFRNLDPGSLALIDAQNTYFDRVYETAMLAGARVIALATMRDDEPLPPLRIKGIHNKENALFAREIARYFEVSEDDIAKGLSSFEPIRHRLQHAGTIKGTQWYNDSKATNPDATLKALSAFESQRPILLLGGQNKDNDMRPLARIAGQVASAVVCFGEDGAQIADAFDPSYDAHLVCLASMADAMKWAYDHCEEAEVVLLSPACSSFDEFTGYEQRGEVFCTFVAQHTDEG